MSMRPTRLSYFSFVERPLSKAEEGTRQSLRSTIGQLLALRPEVTNVVNKRIKKEGSPMNVLEECSRVPICNKKEPPQFWTNNKSEFLD